MARTVSITYQVEGVDAAKRHVAELDAAIDKSVSGNAKLGQTLGSLSGDIGGFVGRLKTFGSDIVTTLGGARQAVSALGEEFVRRLSASAISPDVAANLGVIATHAGVSSTALLAVAGAIAAVAGAIAIGLKQLIDYGSHISDLAARTGLSTTEVQSLGFAAKLTGTSVESVTRAISLMSRNLLDGEKSAVRAVSALNLNLAELQAMQPGRAFEVIATAIQRIPDPMRQSQVALELFGRSGADLLPLIKEGVGDLREEFERLGIGLGTNTVAASDKTGDSLTKLWEVGKALLNGVVAPFVPLLGALADAFLFVLGPVTRLTTAISEGLVTAFTWGLDKAKAFFSYLSGEAAAITGAAARQAIDLSRATLLQSQAFDMSSRGAAVNLDALGGLENVYGVLNQELKNQAEAHKQSEAAASRHAKEQERLNEQLSRGTVALQSFYTVASQNVPGFQAAPMAAGWWESMLAGSSAALNASGLPGRQAGAASAFDPGVLSGLPGGVDLEKLWGEKGQSAGEMFGSMAAKAANRAFQGGGNVGRSIGGTIGSELGKKAGEFIGTAIGGTLGSTIGSVVPVVGTILGGLAGSFIGKLFGPKEEERVNDMRDEFIAAAGGLAQLNAEASAAGETLDSLLNAETEQQYQIAVAELNRAFGERNEMLKQQAELQSRIADINAALIPTWDEVKGAMDRYGISLDKAGQAVNAMAMQDAWQKMTNDIDVMNRAGIDVGGMLEDMADEFSGLVGRSKAFGTEIPSNMRPYIEELTRAGKLLDENGVAISDLSTIRWSDPLKSQGDILNETLASLTNQLEELTRALQNMSGMHIDPIRVPIEYDDPGFTPPTFASLGGLIGRDGVQYLARGGSVLQFRPRGTDTVPAMLTPGEFVVDAPTVSRVGGARGVRQRLSDGAGSGNVFNVTINANDAAGGREAAEAFNRTLRRRGVKLAG